MTSAEKVKVKALIETAKEAVQEVLQFKGCTLEEAVEHLEEIQSDIDGYIDGLKDDIANEAD
jgi:hypothetical protein